MITSNEKPALFRQGLYGLLLAKAILHLTSIINGYGLHNDEFLYLAEGFHPLWGYMEGPPVIGWVAGLSQLVLGGTLWAAKIPVVIIGLLSIWLIFDLVREFGGGRSAQFIAGTAWLLSPVYLGSNALFQPVSFNQFCWLLIGWLLVRVINYERPKDWYLLGLGVGLGLLTKYSVVFYLLALFGGLLLTPQRKLLTNRHLWYAAGIALLMWLPNLVWQYIHGFPVILHMQELAETQLVNMTVMDFLAPQLLFHALSILIWLPGLVFLFRSERLRPYRVFGFAFVLLLFLLLLLSGKSYYTYGAYSILFAAGGCFWAEWLGRRSWLIALPLLVNFILIPLGLPLLPTEQMKNYGLALKDNLGMTSHLRWEDGSIRDFGQDYSDMHGWEEMVSTIADFYHSLSPEEQATCMIEAGSYGQAGALNFFRHKYDLPETVSFDASFILWVPEQVAFDRQIIVADSPEEDSRYFQRTTQIEHPQTPNARRTHYIYYREEPTENVSAVWARLVRERTAETFDH